MNISNPLENLRQPQDGDRLVCLRFKTLTPLYTGGLGQQGEQIHPSGLLGGVRHFSCAVAAALGDTEFETAVWGHTGGQDKKPGAKKLALHWDGSRLRKVSLPGCIRIDTGGPRGSWYFNQALEGEIELRLTRLDVSDAHWRILLAALAIQSRHAMFGAKDQFGLGVLQLQNEQDVELVPFSEADVVAAPLRSDGVFLPLQRYLFIKLTSHELELQQLRKGKNDGPPLLQKRLKIALEIRAALRNSLRKPEPDMSVAKSDSAIRNLRHQMLGSLNEYGSAVNLSAVYSGKDGSHEMRVVIALRPEQENERTWLVNKRFLPALSEHGKVTSFILGQRYNETPWALINTLTGWRES